MDYLEKEYQENPLIDFDRRVFNKEGMSFEEDLSDIENNAVKESLQDHLLQQIGFLSKKVPEHIAEFLIYSLDRNGYLREKSINEVIKFFPEYTEEQVEDFIRCMQQMNRRGYLQETCRNVWCFSCRNRNQNIKRNVFKS